MTYKKNLFKFGFLLRIVLAYNASLTRAVKFTEIRGNLPDPSLISNIINLILGPVVTSYPKNSPKFKSFQETQVDKAIREKIEELQPLLQDNDAMTDHGNIMLEDKNDTTIIDFLPKTEENKKMVEDDSFKNKLIKYKKLREKINKSLTKESVSEKTKKLVVKTMDGLIKSLLSSQCKWKRNLRAVKSEKPLDITKKWDSSLQNIRDMLLSITNTNDSSVEMRRNADVFKFLNAIQTVFRSITEDVDIISKKYKILCDFVPKEHNNYDMNPEAMNVNALRNNWDKTDLEEDRCQNVVVCSNELKEFMRIFYLALNDTVVSVIKNYIEMYTRDVNDNENDKAIIKSNLNKITIGFNAGVTKVFVKETQKLMLDKGKTNQANAMFLTNYVTNTIQSVQNFGKQLLKSELRDKILASILDDLNVNLDVDLGNLQREFIHKICNMFRFCNGRYRGRRQGSNNLDKNNLYVQVQLTMANDLTDGNWYRKRLNVKNNTGTRFTSLQTNFRSSNNFTVTRTTLINNNNQLIYGLVNTGIN